MRTFKIIVFMFNCIFLGGYLHADFFEREVSEFIENDGKHSHAILAICPGKDDEAIFILTKADSLDKGSMDCEGRMYLWSISRQPYTLRQTVLKEKKQKEIISAPINGGAMAFTHKNDLLVISSSRITENNYQGEHNLPIHYKFLPADTDSFPDSITIKILEKEYNMRSSSVMAKILPLNQSCLTNVSMQSLINNVFLKLNDEGEIIFKMVHRTGDEICDFTKIDNNGIQVAFVSRENIKVDNSFFWEYSVSILNTDDGSVVKKDTIPGKPYDKIYDKEVPTQGSSIENQLYPKIIFTRNEFLICLFYKKPEIGSKGSLISKCYDKEFSVVWEKELCLIEVAYTMGLPLCAVEMAPLCDSYFVISVLSNEQLEFWVLDTDGNLKEKKNYAKDQKLIKLHGLYALKDSVIAMTTEIKIPKEEKVDIGNLAKAKRQTMLYSIDNRK